MAALDAYGPFDAGPGANFFEDRWRKMMRHMLGSASGVIRGFDSEFAVFADSSGMQVKVGTGQCFMRGHWGESTAQQTLAVAAANATNPRRDAVVLRADFLNNVVEVAVLTGTPAVSPVAPALTQNTSLWETYLAYVDVAAGAVTVAAANVVDNRMFTSVHAKFQRSTAQTIGNTTSTKIAATTIAMRSGDIRANGTATEFELLRSGLWSVVGNFAYAPNGTGHREIRIEDSADPAIGYARFTIPNASAGLNCYMNCSATEYLPAGKKLSLIAFQNSGANLDIIANSVNLTLTWVGP